MKKPFSVADNRPGGKLFNFRPALFAAAFFALGILFAYGRAYRALSLWWLAAGVPVLGLSVFFAAERRKALFAACALCLCFVCGLLSFGRELRSFENCGSYAGEHIVAGTVAEKEEYGGVCVLRLTGLYIDGAPERGTLAAAVGASLAEKARLSDQVVLRGVVETDTRAFDERGFRAGEIADGVRFSARVASLEVTGRDNNAFRAVRSRLKSALYAGMDDDAAAVTYAVLTGDTSGIERGLLENVRRGGVAHLFAVSGLHVGALYAFCLLLFRKTRLKALPKPVRFFAVAAILVFYGGVCGFSASVVRASVMCLVLYASSLVGTKPDLLESAGLAALLLLAFHPVLLFDAGFQLSFAACLSIGAFSRAFRDALSLPFARRAAPAAENTPAGGFARLGSAGASFLSVTLAAQAGTAPVLLSSFGYVSLPGLFLNCLFVPLVGAVFALLLALALVASLLPLAAAPALLYLPSTLWSALLLLFYAADFSSFSLENVRLGPAAILFYLFFILLSDKINLPKRQKAFFLGTVLIAFAVSAAAINF